MISSGFSTFNKYLLPLVIKIHSLPLSEKKYINKKWNGRVEVREGAKERESGGEEYHF